MIVITKEIFRELLKLLIQTQSVKLNITGISQWLPLPKKNKKAKENDDRRKIRIRTKTLETLNRGFRGILKYEKLVF